MALFNQRPALAFAAEEEVRGDGLTTRIQQIASDPSNPSNDSLPLYRMAARDAYSNAAQHTPQPERDRL